MKILQVITLSELGGAQSVVANLSNKLSEDNDVIVAAGEGDGKMFQLLNESIKREHIPNLVRRISPFDEIRAIHQMKNLYKMYKPDIIHLHSSKAGILGRLAFPKSKIVYTVHGFDSIRIAYRKFLPIERLLQYRCAAIVGVSKYDEINLRAEGITNNVGFVYNGIYRPIHIQNNPFAHLKEFESKVLCIARLSPQKNHNLFIETAKLMPNTAFIWIGNQTHPEFEIPNNVFFLGNITNAGSYTSYADVFILPSNYEGLPMVIIEALANGTPVVASSVGGITELLNGENGFAVENDPRIFSSKLQSILSSNKIAHNMSDAAKNSYEAAFTVDSMTNGYLKIYKQICNINH